MEVAILVVFVGLVSATLFGSVVPAYRTAAGAEVGDRALVAVASQVDDAARAPASVVERRVSISMPRVIRGVPYVVRATDGSRNVVPTLVLDHPRAGIGGRITLVVPSGTTVDGELRSTETPTVVVSHTENGTMAVVLR